MADDARPALLFVTRKFPPSVGGMETLAASAWRALERQPVRAGLVALGGRQWWLPLFVPWAALRIVAARLRRPGTVVLCGDALLQTLLWPVLRLTGTRHATMVMGLDLTWRVAPYQWCLRRALRSARRVIAISSATADVARARGIAADRVAVLRLAVPVPVPAVTPAERAAARAALCERFGLPQRTLLLVSVSRLVRRKGMRWFVEAVLPRREDASLLIAGSGPEHEGVAAAIAARGLAGRCRLLGAVDDATRELLLRGGDAFVQPNLPVAGDMEGFGLVAIEAAARGALVVAADLEGLKDAVLPGTTGLLLPPGDAAAWTATLAALAADPAARAARAADYAAACRREYDLDAMGDALTRLVLDDAPPAAR